MTFRKIGAAGAVLLAALALAASASALTPFGIAPGSFAAGSFQPDGVTNDTQAGAHPFLARTEFSLNADAEGFPESFVKDTTVELPPGFVGDPNATPRCPMAEMLQNSQIPTGGCPNDTVVGEARVRILRGGSTLETDLVPIFNIAPSPDQVAVLGFKLANFPSLVEISVRAMSDYGLSATVADISQEASLVSARLTLWGVPAAAGHDLERGISCSNLESSVPEDCLEATSDKAGPSDALPLPFLADPAACEGHPLTTVLDADPWEQPGLFDTAIAVAPEPTGCSLVHFNPSISLSPDTTRTGAPVGVSVDLSVPQSQDPASLATSPLRRASVTLPAGMTLTPAAAAGLGACTPSQIGIGSDAPVTCPEASKLGTVRIESPSLPENADGSEGAITGFAYLGRPEASLDTAPPYPLYLDASGYGLDVKLKGSVEPDARSGQVTATFAENPPLPFDHLSIRFKGGPTAPLVNPPDCGPQITTTQLAPFSAPDTLARPTSSFTTSADRNGAGCPATRPFTPSVDAGSEGTVAGKTASFRLQLTSPDGDQALSTLDVTTPPGLSADLKGIPYCPEAGIAAAAQSSGTAEAASPSCPAASQVGTVGVGIGAGSSPLRVAGTAYLAGPYKGAPLSLLFVTPALAGPFD
jgi:hypothetical protein